MSWVRLQTAADQYGISLRTLRRWIKHKGLRYSRVCGCAFVDSDDIDTLLEHHIVKDDTDQIIKELMRDFC